MPVDDLRAMLETDLTALFALTQLVGAAMTAAGGGSIVNVASLATERSVDRYPRGWRQGAGLGPEVMLVVMRSVRWVW